MSDEEWIYTNELRFIRDQSFKGDQDFAPKILQQRLSRRIYDKSIKDGRLLGIEEKWENVPLVEV